MPQLIVRDVPPDVARALKQRAARNGRSAEAEHRILLRDALQAELESRSFKALLISMPDVGTDADFAPARPPARAGVSWLLDTIIVSELRKGERADERLRTWFASVDDDEVLTSVLPIDVSVADRWGTLNVPDPIPTVDGLLAATALVHDLTLVTRIVKDVATTGVMTLDPTTGASG